MGQNGLLSQACMLWSLWDDWNKGFLKVHETIGYRFYVTTQPLDQAY